MLVRIYVIGSDRHANSGHGNLRVIGMVADCTKKCFEKGMHLDDAFQAARKAGMRSPVLAIDDRESLFYYLDVPGISWDEQLFSTCSRCGMNISRDNGRWVDHNQTTQCGISNHKPL